MHGNDKEKMKVARERVLGAYEFSSEKPEETSFIKEIIMKDKLK